MQVCSRGIEPPDEMQSAVTCTTYVLLTFYILHAKLLTFLTGNKDDSKDWRNFNKKVVNDLGQRQARGRYEFLQV